LTGKVLGRKIGGGSSQARIGHGPGAIEGREDGNLQQPLRALSRTGESGRVIGGNDPAATRQPGQCFRIMGSGCPFLKQGTCQSLGARHSARRKLNPGRWLILAEAWAGDFETLRPSVITAIFPCKKYRR